MMGMNGVIWGKRFVQGEDIDISINSDDTPYVTFSYNGEISVKKLMGRDWLFVGEASFK